MALTEETITRFWAKVVTTDTCWLWQGAKTRAGYGLLTVSSPRRNVYAHRLSWEVANERALSSDEHVCHSCDTPACVRPDHLFLGNARINAADRVQKGRSNTARGEQCYRAKLAAEDVRFIRSSDLSRTELAAAFGMSNEGIRGVQNGTRWRHV